jgi:hypothetical protein
MAENRAGTLALLAMQAGRFFGPLQMRLRPETILSVFTELGTAFPIELSENSGFRGSVISSETSLEGLRNFLVQLATAIETNDPSAIFAVMEDATDSFDAVENSLDAIAAALIAAGPGIPGFSQSEVNAFAADLPTRLLHWSAVTYMEEASPEFASLFDLFGVIDRIEEQVGSTDPKRPQFTRMRLHLDELPDMLFSPFGVLEARYGFGTAGFDGAALFTRLESILSRTGLPVLNEPGVGLDVVFAQLVADPSVSPPALTFNLRTRFDQEFELSSPPLTATMTARLNAPAGAALTFEPSFNFRFAGPSASSTDGELSLHIALGPLSAAEQFIVLGSATGSRLEFNTFGADAGVQLVWDPSINAAKGRLAIAAQIQGLHLVVTPPAGDGFLASFIPPDGLDARFDVGVAVTAGGVTFNGSGSLVLNLPVHLTLGPVAVDEIAISLGIEGSTVPIGLGASIRTSIGPFDAVVQGIGVSADLSFPSDGDGNLGPIQADIGFLSPTGIGVSVDTGGVKGGGFLFLDAPAGRYGGALELSVFGIAVKAIGLIETQLPDGSSGFSFIIIISAEFIPIQLGFGFTLLGVGGIIGINRGLSEEGLGGALQDGSLDTILFPSDPVRDAPSIIQNLANIFPPARDHFVFGPTAKLGWGTPTLVHASLGIVLELPGPRLAVLGVVRTSLPTEEFALVRLQLAISGVLDFPGRRFSLDARLYDSYVGSFSVGGAMAFRLDFGATPNFVLAIGGFNPSYKAPPGFPSLARVSIDLGLSGNPSLTASGYLALTPNTAQIGAGLDLRASGAGIRLHGHLGFDAMFVFSPFSFTARIHAGVSVRFHGVGFGIHLNGRLSGPSPWHLDGEVCVSVLWWDACLGIDVTFGESRRAELPPIDPWFGLVPFDPQRPVLGLQAAIQDPRNWTGSTTAGAVPVVALAERPAGVPSPVDPVGAATLRQKVVPLNQKITKFGEFKPVGHDTFKVTTVLIGGVEQSNVVAEQEDFVPAHFREMDGAARLSAKPFDKMDAGFTVNAHLATVGTLGEKEIVYETQLLDGNRERVGPQPLYPLTRRHLLGMLNRSAAGLGGSRRSGFNRYFNPLRKVTLRPERFVVADACTLAPNFSIVPSAGATQTAAALAVEAHLANTPADQGRFAVIPSYELF